ncbi:MAG TPA: hypothetical protein VKE70_07345 [Candidatus Solibacter sp.]|nr:hypothetical protein [Candidatus Solibacter sp.]
MIDRFPEALKELTTVLDALGIRYAVGGSLACSMHGVFRATDDGDLIAEIHPLQLPQLAASLGKGWYAEVPAMQSALRAGRAFNLIHMGAAFKFDIFPATTEFHAAQLDRAEIKRLRMEGAPPCRVTTAEDILLAKLCWFRQGGEVSDRQWNDIVGLMTSNKSLDSDYLDHWAARLRVTDLLEKARTDAAH